MASDLKCDEDTAEAALLAGQYFVRFPTKLGLYVSAGINRAAVARVDTSVDTFEKFLKETEGILEPQQIADPVARFPYRDRARYVTLSREFKLSIPEYKSSNPANGKPLLLHRFEVSLSPEELQELFLLCKHTQSHRHLVVMNEIALDEARQLHLPVDCSMVIRCKTPAHEFDHHNTNKAAREADWEWFQTQQKTSVPTNKPGVSAMIQAPLLLRSTDFISQGNGSSCPNLTSACIPRATSSAPMLCSTPAANLWSSYRAISPLILDEITDLHHRYKPDQHLLLVPFPSNGDEKDGQPSYIYRYSDVLSKNYCENLSKIHNSASLQLTTRDEIVGVEPNGENIHAQRLYINAGADGIAAAHQHMRIKLGAMKNVIDVGTNGMTFVFEAYGDAEQWKAAKGKVIKVLLGLTFHYTVLTVPHRVI